MIRSSSADPTARLSPIAESPPRCRHASEPAALEALRQARRPLLDNDADLPADQAMVHAILRHDELGRNLPASAPAGAYVTEHFTLAPGMPAQRRASLPLHTWRGAVAAPDQPLRGDPWDPPTSRELRHSTALRRHRYELDCMRDRMEAFVSPTGYSLNHRGMLERRDFAVLYRVDSRSPEELCASDGFGPSRQVLGVARMIDGDVLITSACLRASDVVLNRSRVPEAALRQNQPVYQYAIRAEGVRAASWAENYKLRGDLPQLPGCSHELGLDEVHADATQVRAEHIYIIGASDAALEQRLEALLDEQGNASPFGVDIRSYTEHARADAAHTQAFLQEVQQAPAQLLAQWRQLEGLQQRRDAACVAGNARYRGRALALQGDMAVRQAEREAAQRTIEDIGDSLVQGTLLPDESAARSALLLAPHIIAVLPDLPAGQAIVLVDEQDRHWRYRQQGEQLVRRIAAARPGDIIIMLPRTRVCPNQAGSRSSLLPSHAEASERLPETCSIAVVPPTGSTLKWQLLSPPTTARTEQLFGALVRAMALLGVPHDADTPLLLRRHAAQQFARRARTQAAAIDRQHHADQAFMDAATALWSALERHVDNRINAFTTLDQTYRHVLERLAGAPHLLSCLLLDDRCHGLSVNLKLAEFLRENFATAIGNARVLMPAAQQFLADHLAVLRALRDSGVVPEASLNMELARGQTGSLLHLLNDNRAILRQRPLAFTGRQDWDPAALRRLAGRAALSEEAAAQLRTEARARSVAMPRSPARRRQALRDAGFDRRVAEATEALEQARQALVDAPGQAAPDTYALARAERALTRAIRQNRDAMAWHAAASNLLGRLEAEKQAHDAARHRPQPTAVPASATKTSPVTAPSHRGLPPVIAARRPRAATPVPVLPAKNDKTDQAAPSAPQPGPSSAPRLEQDGAINAAPAPAPASPGSSSRMSASLRQGGQQRLAVSTLPAGSRLVDGRARVPVRLSHGAWRNEPAQLELRAAPDHPLIVGQPREHTPIPQGWEMREPTPGPSRGHRPLAPQLTGIDTRHAGGVGLTLQTREQEHRLFGRGATLTLTRHPDAGQLRLGSAQAELTAPPSPSPSGDRRK